MFARNALLALIGSSALVFGLTGDAAAKTLETVASFTVLADVVKNVGGNHVLVRSLVHPEGDPHDFEPSPDDVKAVRNADVVFMSGLGLETWFKRLAKAADASKPPISVSDGIKPRMSEEDGKTAPDPHVWNSVPNVLIWVENIEKALEKADPEDSADFKKNAKHYSGILRKLDSYVRQRFASLPAGKRKVLTSHDAFTYYGQEYGVEFLAPLGVSTEMEASAGDVAALIDQIRKEHITAFFLENSTDTRLVEQIAKATSVRPGGTLYPESLSETDGPVLSYAQLIRHNTDLIVNAIK